MIMIICKNVKAALKNINFECDYLCANEMQLIQKCEFHSFIYICSFILFTMRYMQVSQTNDWLCYISST